MLFLQQTKMSTVSIWRLERWSPFTRTQHYAHPLTSGRLSQK